MSPTLAEASAERDGCAAPYQRHRPERTLLYQIVEQHYPAFVSHMAQQERPLPAYVQREFEDYLRCGRLDQGFLRVRCDTCHAEHLVAFSCKGRGAWSRVRPCGSMRCSPSSRCASGVRRDRLSGGQTQRAERSARKAGLGLGAREGCER